MHDTLKQATHIEFKCFNARYCDALPCRCRFKSGQLKLMSRIKISTQLIGKVLKKDCKNFHISL